MTRLTTFLTLVCGLALAACGGKYKVGEADTPRGTPDVTETMEASGDAKAGDVLGPDACVPRCVDEQGRQQKCGPDGCGGSCGTCGDGQECGGFATGGFGCCPICEYLCADFGAQCGSAGLGVCYVTGTDAEGLCDCGECAAGLVCADYDCGLEFSCSVCVPEEDACGGQLCGDGEVCVDGGLCCAPSCDGKKCGDDGCGGQCGCGENEGCEEVDQGYFLCLAACPYVCSALAECGFIDEWDGVGCDCGGCDDGNPCTKDACSNDWYDWGDALPDEGQKATVCLFEPDDSAACDDGNPLTLNGCVEGQCLTLCQPQEEVCDGKDNDCDGQVDEGYADLDQDGIADCVEPPQDDGDPCPDEVDCDPLDPDVCAYLDEWCDGKDNDCDFETDEGLGTTTCGLGPCEHTVANCSEGHWVKCDPLEGAAADLCDVEDNGVDDDCDGQIDEVEAEGCTQYWVDNDWDGWAGTMGCFCAKPPNAQDAPEDCCDADPDANPGQTKYFQGPVKVCGGFDYNCDGAEEPQYKSSCIEPPCSAGWFEPTPGCGEVAQWCLNCSGCGSCIGQTIQQKQKCR